jgi:hypothetical protein
MFPKINLCVTCWTRYVVIYYYVVIYSYEYLLMPFPVVWVWDEPITTCDGRVCGRFQKIIAPDGQFAF